MLAFIDEIVIPFLNSLYGAVGYLGVMLAMAIESAMIPLPSELILPFAGFLVSDPSQIEPITGQPWNFWLVVIAGDDRQHARARSIAYGHRRIGRPAVPRALRPVPAHPPARDRLGRPFFAKHGAATVFFGRLLPIVRTFIWFPAGVARMNLGQFILYSTAGALPGRCLLVYAGVAARRQLGARSGTRSSRSTSRSRSCVVVAVVLFIWWRLGMPGRPGRRPADAD